MPFPLRHKKLIRGCTAHLKAGLGCGADYVAFIGTPIYASHNGTLYEPYFWKFGLGQGGKWIGLKRENGDKIEHAHLSKYVKKSGKVVAGELIGYTGNTGTITTGPHLHTQIFDSSGVRLDPEKYDWTSDDGTMDDMDKKERAAYEKKIAELNTEIGRTIEERDACEETLRAEREGHKDTLEKFQGCDSERDELRGDLKVCQSTESECEKTLKAIEEVIHHG